MIDPYTINNFPKFDEIYLHEKLDWWFDMNCMIGILIQIERCWYKCAKN